MKAVAVVGGGPAGLMAAEVLGAAGVQVHLYDAMPSVGRKFLLAGRGGLNLTHSEPLDAFIGRFGERRAQAESMLRQFGPQQVQDWAHGLGIETFVGTSGRVFPKDMKAAPLLRAWLHRLRAAGVQFHMRHRWLGWPDERPTRLRFATPDGEGQVDADAVLLALGGASWSRLGSDGAWAPWLAARGVAVAPLQPANCGFDVGWSEHFASRFAGQPFKSVAIAFTDRRGRSFARKGEFVATATGIEGSLVYAASALLRDEIEAARAEGVAGGAGGEGGEVGGVGGVGGVGTGATLHVDLLPDRSAAQVLAAVQHPRGARSLSSHLKSRLGLDGIKSGLLHEQLTREEMHDPPRLAEAIKALPLRVRAARPIDEAISSAGGVRFDALDAGLMLPALPGVFCAGEMLDWEAPTGGYLLTLSMASGVVAAQGVLRRVQVRS